MKLNYIFTSIIILLFSSCTDHFLDLDDPDQVTEDTYFNSPERFREATNELYTYLNSFRSKDLGENLLDYGSDLSSTPPDQADYGNGNVSVPIDDDYWSKRYSYIRAANKVLQLSEDYSNQEEIAQEIAEAKFFRAWFHFELMKYFGGIPIVTRVLETDSEELYSKRNSRYEVTEQILQDLDDAINDLPLEANIEASYKGLISQQAAKAFKARVLLHEATWMKYVGTSTDGDGETSGAGSEGYDVANIDLYLAEAAELSEEILNDATYELFDYNSQFENMSSYFLFNIDNTSDSNPLGLDKSANKEFIFYRVHDIDLFHDGNPSQLGRSAPSRKMMDMILCSDGLPIEKSSVFQGYAHAGSEYLNRDYRMKAYFSSYYIYGDYTDLTSGVPTDSNVALVGYTDADAGSGYKNQKYERWGYGTNSSLSNNGGINYPYIRLAECYLTYAEALYELNGELTDVQLDASINKTRARAGLPALSNSFIDTHSLDLREEIRREWAIEFFAEASRFNCLKRWGIAEAELDDPQCGMVVEGTPFEFDSDLYKVEYYHYDPLAVDLPNGETLNAIQIAPSSIRNFSLKNYLHPIPSSQIRLVAEEKGEEVLLQNPGY